jgi:hypothetical protein
MADEPGISPDTTPSPSTGDNAPSPSAQDVSSAQSSSADQGETKQTLLEAVQQAVPELRSSRQQEDELGSGASPAQVAKPGEGARSAPELPDDPTQQELSKYSQSAKDRVERLLDQRRDLRAEVQRLKTLEPSAQAADSVTKYLRDNDIGREDFLMTLELASAMRRGDFRTFYEGIKPYVRLAEEYLGMSLPPDLQQQVQQGHMTTQAAATLSKERMDRAMAQNNAVRQNQAFREFQTNTQNEQQQAARVNLANQVRDTVNTWEQRIAQSDPDYTAHKKTAVQDTMWAVMREQGVPQSPDHAVKIAEEALRRVNERYRSWAPQKRPTSRTPSSTGRTAGAAPEPKSLAEAVRFAREGARL